MMIFLRKHRRWLMAVILVLAIPFIFYFVQSPDYGAIKGDRFATIYDRDVTMVEAQRNARLYELARALGFTGLPSLGGGTTEGERYVQFNINLIILRHEAARLGIRPTPSETADFVRNLPAFRGPSGFDINKYNEFAQTALSPNGLSEAHIEELATDELALNRIKQLLALNVFVSDAESKANYEQANGKLTVSVIRLRGADLGKDVKVSDEDVKKYFEARQKELKTEEKRKVDFVSLSLNDEQKKLAGKERIEVLQKQADRANELTEALAVKGADFREVAAKFQLPVETTGEFTVQAPDPKLKDPQLATAAFQLSADAPNTDPVQVGDGFYILHLAGIDPSRPLTLEEAKGKIVEAIKANRVRELISNQGAKVSHDMREGLRAGEPLPFALAKSNVKAEKVPPFTLLEDADPNDPNKPKDRPPDFVAIRSAAAQLQPGEVSEFLPWEDGGIIAVLEKRDPPDEVKYRENKPGFDERVLRTKREIVFREWLRERQVEALGEAAKKSEPPARGG